MTQKLLIDEGCNKAEVENRSVPKREVWNGRRVRQNIVPSELDVCLWERAHCQSNTKSLWALKYHIWIFYLLTGERRNTLT
jgi:hypothetical protein